PRRPRWAPRTLPGWPSASGRTPTRSPASGRSTGASSRSSRRRAPPSSRGAGEPRSSAPRPGSPRPEFVTRAEMLARALARRTPWDMVVIGGGATGVGVAVDAAARGYDVLLLEAHDFGKGTSSRSTKLAHGGVRYL